MSSETAILTIPAEELDAHIDALLAARRESCYCQRYRKPCPSCGDYWDGLTDLAECVINGADIGSSEGLS